MAAGVTTAEQLLRAQDLGRCELVRGRLRMMIPPGWEHGRTPEVLGEAEVLPGGDVLPGFALPMREVFA